MVSATDPYRGVCRIDRDSFTALIRQMAAPAVVAERDPGEYWDAIWTKYHADPTFILAIFNHESNMGKNGTATQTHSWGNTRTPNFGATPVGTVAGRSGTFPVWRNWLDGCISTVARLTDPSYYYAKENRTIGGVFTVEPSWAPAGDMNDPAGYLRSVLDFMNAHASQHGGATVAADDPKAVWSPSSNYTGGRAGCFVDHITSHGTYGAVGENSLNWLRGAAGGTSNTDSSATYLVSRAGEIWQLVRESDTPWSDGNGLYNQSGISIEHEHAQGQDWPDAQIAASIGLQSRIAQRQGWKAVTHPGAAVLPEGGPPGTANLIGHSQVPSETNPNQGGGNSGHTGCPGADFPWARIVNGVNAALGGTPAPQPKPDNPNRHYFAQTHHWVGGGFWQFWQHRGGLKIFGYPLSEEFRGSDGLTTQWFERACFTWEKGADPKNWDVVLKRLGAADMGTDQKAHADAFKPAPGP